MDRLVPTENRLSFLIVCSDLRLLRILTKNSIWSLRKFLLEKKKSMEVWFLHNGFSKRSIFKVDQKNLPNAGGYKAQWIINVSLREVILETCFCSSELQEYLWVWLALGRRERWTQRQQRQSSDSFWKLKLGFWSTIRIRIPPWAAQTKPRSKEN